MELLSQLAPSVGAGLSGALLLWMWRKCAARWSTWFPLLKKSLELLLWLWALGSAVLIVLSVAGAADVRLGVLGALLGFALPSGWDMVMSRRTGKEEVKRGTTIATPQFVKRQVKASKKRSRLELGDVPIPFDAEPYHQMFAGSTGTGKSVAINAVLDQLRAANDTVILVDSGGEFLSKHFRADSDFVFNPFDERCVNWSPVLEMQGEWDAEAMARSIVPDGVGDSKEWNGYAQTLVASVMRQLYLRGKMTLQDFLYYVQAASTAELKELLQGTSAAAQLSSEKTFGSIRTIAANYLTAYAYLPNAGQPFSVSEMIRAEHSGFLFVTYREDQLDSLRSLIGCILDVASRAILSLSPNPERRIWLVLDEFASIGKVQSIEAVATKARKNGGCLLLGLQTVSQLRDRYGEFGAQTILSCLSTWLVLRCGDADTAEYMSKYIGDVELLRQARSSSVSDTGESTSHNDQQLTQRAILPSQIQGLPNLSGFLKLAGNYPLCQVKLPIPTKSRPVVTSAFEARDFEARPMLRLSPTQAAPAGSAPAKPASAAAPAAPASAKPASRPPQSPATEAKVARPPLPLSAVSRTAEKAVSREQSGLPEDSRVLVVRPAKSNARPSLEALRGALNQTSRR
ncbi:Coupling protein TraD [compost metagenome]